jgi:hypothetical protein
MPWFTLQGLATSGRHRLIGLDRVARGHKRDHYIEELRRRGVVLHPVTERSRHYVDCPFCGYALASFEITPDWIVETCSAFLLPEMIRNPQFAKYVSRLSKPENRPALQSGQVGDHSRPIAVPAAPGSD